MKKNKKDLVFGIIYLIFACIYLLLKAHVMCIIFFILGIIKFILYFFVPDDEKEELTGKKVKNRTQNNSCDPKPKKILPSIVPAEFENEISDETIGCSYKINGSFLAHKSHAAEVEMISTYARSEDEIFSGNTHVFLQTDPAYETVTEYIETGNIEKAEFVEKTEGFFMFRAKIQNSDGYMTYMYGYDYPFDEEENDYIGLYHGLCMEYPIEYEGTEDEKTLMKILDDAAASFKIIDKNQKTD